MMSYLKEPLKIFRIEICILQLLQNEFVDIAKLQMSERLKSIIPKTQMMFFVKEFQPTLAAPQTNTLKYQIALPNI